MFVIRLIAFTNKSLISFINKLAFNGSQGVANRVHRERAHNIKLTLMYRQILKLKLKKPVALKKGWISLEGCLILLFRFLTLKVSEAFKVIERKFLIALPRFLLSYPHVLLTTRLFSPYQRLLKFALIFMFVLIFFGGGEC